MPNVKVALTGKMRSGKDTVADYLAEHYGFTRFAFGDGIKRVCSELFPDQFADGKKPRALLQGVGQAMRAFDPDVWANRTLDKIDREDKAIFRGAYKLLLCDEVISEVQANPLQVVITDLRQPNEYARLYTEGYVIIRVNASDDTRLERMRSAGDTFDLADLTHDTERYVDVFAVDYELNNNGTVRDLYEQIDVVMREITS
ncbi:deoxynucleotide monophosphate kinase family protein [Brevibacillus daliensis]|uniref:deoxynucleotide monophosphate kinase family protein n=1 Tax=Brevibacillus daliensis TaxID=2892995 RepID=UPI001E64520A|nr:AAA family ATPase [Brevibacillus daliensis]